MIRYNTSYCFWVVFWALLHGQLCSWHLLEAFAVDDFHLEALVPLADVFNHRCQKVPKNEAVPEIGGDQSVLELFSRAFNRFPAFPDLFW